MKKIFLVLCLAVLFMLFIFFLLDHEKQKKDNVENIQTKKNIIKFNVNDEKFQEESVLLNDSWFLYKNYILGFEFEYPSKKFAYGILKPSFFKSEASMMNPEQKYDSYIVSFSDGDSSRITVIVTQTDFKSIDEWLSMEKSQYKEGGLYAEKMNISGYDAFLTYPSDYNKNLFTDNDLVKSLTFIKGEIMIQIVTYALSENEREEIRSSFKFLK